MAIVLVTGSGGLVGSETARFYLKRGNQVIGIDNDMRAYFFGAEASTAWSVEDIKKEHPKNYIHFQTDIRNTSEINRIFAKFGSDIVLVVHAAAQPSHDWAAKEPMTDFTVNANGTLNLLEAVRTHAKDAVFI